MKYTFAGVAIDQTSNWNLPELSAVKDCLIYLHGCFRVGEATHLCSFTPNSWVIGLGYEFMNRNGSPLSKAQRDEIDRDSLWCEGIDDDYYGYINPDNVDTDRHVSATFDVDLDDSDYEDSEEGRREQDREAWDEAREYAQGNSAAIYPPVFHGAVFA